MERLLVALVVASQVTLACLFPQVAHPAEQAMSVGYGFAILNPDGWHSIQDGKQYDFGEITYLYERHCSSRVSFVVEPYLAYVNKPRTGGDAGFSAGLKYYIVKGTLKGRRAKFYARTDVGSAYSTIKFREQGTHLFFILQAAFGIRYGNFFLEDRFRHYSNGQTAYPNRSVNANVISLGYYF